jgi:hypothetical protein
MKITDEILAERILEFCSYFRINYNQYFYKKTEIVFYATINDEVDRYFSEIDFTKEDIIEHIDNNLTFQIDLLQNRKQISLNFDFKKEQIVLVIIPKISIDRNSFYFSELMNIEKLFNNIIKGIREL